MPGGAFNVTQLIRELGLKALTGEEMRVLDTIQPTMSVGNLSDVTPPHVAASAFFGALIVGLAGQVGQIELQCLAPGGGFVDWFTFSATASNARFRVVTTPSGVATPVPPAGVTSRDPIVSVVNQGSLVAAGAPSVTLFQTGVFVQFGLRPIFVPRGSFFQMEMSTVALSGVAGFGWREVPASEHVPS